MPGVNHVVISVNSSIFLVFAILSEVLGTICLKLSRGFTETLPTLGVVAFYGSAFYLLSLALREVEVGVAYAVWSGAGTALIALVGIAFFGEGVSFVKVGSLLLLITGVVGLNLSGGMH